MYIPFRTIVNDYIDESKPITGIIHIGPYYEEVHDQYKCYTKASVTWIDRNDLNRIRKDNLLGSITPANFMNVTLDGNELQILEYFRHFIHEHVDYIYTQIYSSHGENCGVTSTFRSMNEFMSICNFNLKAFKMIDKQDYTKQGGALYKRISNA